MITFTKEDFNLFTRFLKERGQYKFVMRYLFPKGRTIENLREDLAKKDFSFSYNFGDILHLTSSLGVSYANLGHEYWEKYISPISNDWIAYYKLHKNNGKIC